MIELKSQAFVLRGCFARDPSTPVALPSPTAATYVVEEKTVDFFEGEKRRFVEKPYPITQDLVNSYAEATDYRTNSAAFLPPRQNLGDVRDVQREFEHGDISSIRARVVELQNRLKAVQDQLDRTQSEQAETASGVVVDAQNNSQSEVKNDG